MALTDPAGDPTLLQEIVANEHLAIRGVLDEALKAIPTPGVHKALVEHLRRRLRDHRHCNALVDGELRAELGDDAAERLSDSMDRLVDGGEDLVELAAVWREHEALHDELLAELRSAAGGRRLAALAWLYGSAAESGAPS